MPIQIPDNKHRVQKIIEASRKHFAREFVATTSTFKAKAILAKRNFKKTNKKSEVFPD